MADFATKTELAAYWRTLTSAEETRADILLGLASNRLRLIAEDFDVDLDAKVAASPPFASTIRWVVMEAVKRALQTPTDVPPVETYQKAAGPYSENYKFTNPSGDLWFKKSELKEIDLYGSQTIESVSTTPNNDIYAS